MLKCFRLHSKEALWRKEKVSPTKIITDSFHRSSTKLRKWYKDNTRLPLYNNCSEQLGHHLLSYPLSIFSCGASLAHVLPCFWSSNPGFCFHVCSLASHFAMIFFFPRWRETSYRAVCVNTSVSVWWETGACSTQKAVELYTTAFHCSQGCFYLSYTIFQ